MNLSEINIREKIFITNFNLKKEEFEIYSIKLFIILVRFL